MRGRLPANGNGNSLLYDADSAGRCRTKDNKGLNSPASNDIARSLQYSELAVLRMKKIVFTYCNIFSFSISSILFPCLPQPPTALSGLPQTAFLVRIAVTTRSNIGGGDPYLPQCQAGGPDDIHQYSINRMLVWLSSLLLLFDIQYSIV